MQTNSPHLSDGLGLRLSRDADKSFIESLHNTIRDDLRLTDFVSVFSCVIVHES